MINDETIFIGSLNNKRLIINLLEINVHYINNYNSKNPYLYSAQQHFQKIEVPSF